MGRENNHGKKFILWPPVELRFCPTGPVNGIEPPENSVGGSARVSKNISQGYGELGRITQTGPFIVMYLEVDRCHIYEDN